MKLYVEGGGDSKGLKIACRKGFSEFLKKVASLKGKMPRIVACGSRQNAYKSYCMAIQSGEDALVLVDSEAPVAANCRQDNCPSCWKPWQHLKKCQGDQWEKPYRGRDKDCHLMVQCMEAWFLADRKALQGFFKQGFNENALPSQEKEIESVDRKNIYKSLSKATKYCKTKTQYDKGKHSFQILACISPDLIAAASPWAKRFLDILKGK
ncbi:MAG: hypothetical protein CSB21_02180 [Deltaproteobacteria bacterium]|nr:MAG: hypothetical protein CSB21_02180 [Deltaproteobacteria bacterium]